MKNEAFMPNVRHHSDLVETDAAFQITTCYAAGFGFYYADTLEEAEALAERLRQEGPQGIGPNNNRLYVDIHERGDFVPHYTYDEE